MSLFGFWILDFRFWIKLPTHENKLCYNFTVTTIAGDDIKANELVPRARRCGAAYKTAARLLWDACGPELGTMN
jgi:hypothetical protein